MIKRKIVILSLALFCTSFTLFAQVGPFQLSTPEEEGIPSESINALVTAWEKEIHSVHSFMLLRHGKLVAEGWWDPFKKEDPHVLFSLSKSFTSAAIGFAVQEKLLSIDDKVITFFPDDLPENPSDYLKAMRIKDLLTMSTGQRNDSYGTMISAKDSNYAKAFLTLPVEHKPGTLFIYNTGATYMLSAIIQKVTGKKLVDYLQPRLFDPLDIKHPTWDESPQGINIGGTGLYVSTEAIAKFGQLYLQKGVWNNKQIISESWISQSSSKQVSNGSDPESNWDQGYGFQFWRNRKYGYRADGAFGQFCFVLPEFDLVLAITSGTSDMKGVIDIVWDKLLPSLEEKKLKENPQALASLKAKLNHMALPSTAGKDFSIIAKKVSGKTYQLEDNELGLKSIVFFFNKKTNSIQFTTIKGSETIFSETGKWKPTETSLNGNLTYSTGKKLNIACSAAWISDDTFEADICYKETEFIIKVLFKFTGNEVTMQGTRNVSFSPTKIPDIKGTAKKK